MKIPDQRNFRNWVKLKLYPSVCFNDYYDRWYMHLHNLIGNSISRMMFHNYKYRYKYLKNLFTINVANSSILILKTSF